MKYHKTERWNSYDCRNRFNVGSLISFLKLECGSNFDDYSEALRYHSDKHDSIKLLPPL